MSKRHISNSRNHSGLSDQRGISTFGLIGILVGLGVVALSLFLFASTSKSPDTTQDQTADKTAGSQVQASASGEPPFIRIPDNSLIYKNSTYKFSFAYPSGFEKLTETSSSNAAAGSPVFKAESAIATQKPVGNTGTFLSGALGTYVYKKDEFKILIGEPDIYVAATKTGDDTTWKIISRGNTTQDVSIGDSYPVKSIKSQTGVPVFNFSITRDNSVYGRYVFEAGDYYVIVALPFARMPSGTAPSDADLAAYNVIGANIASTVRVQATSSASSSSTTTDSSSSASTSSSSGSTSGGSD